jgi:hypothetical protein
MSATRPIIVIKKKGGHGGHHGGAWKVAYADFVTAMMALFIVLWLMNSSVKIQKAVGGYFKDPSGTADKTGSDMKGAGENFVLSKDNMQDLKEQLQKAVREVPNFEKIKNNIDMTVTNEGLRIELTESATGTFFDSGSAKISGDGAELLIALAQEMGKHIGARGPHGFKAISGRQYVWQLGTLDGSRQRRAKTDDPTQRPAGSSDAGAGIRRSKTPKERSTAGPGESQDFSDRAIFGKEAFVSSRGGRRRIRSLSRRKEPRRRHRSKTGRRGEKARRGPAQRVVEGQNG